MLADPFGEFLTRIGEDYLHQVWTALAAVLHSNGLDAGTLTWGSSHPTYTATTPLLDAESPLAYLGWVLPAVPGPSLWAGAYDLSAWGESIARDLAAAAVPVAISGADIRGSVCRRVVEGVELAPVAPEDVEAGLEVVIARCTDDLADWAPGGDGAGLLDDTVSGRVAEAIVQRDRHALVDALEVARHTCTPAGYRILTLGFADVLLSWLPDDMPNDEPRIDRTPPVSVDIAGGLTMTIGPDGRRRPRWMGLQVGDRGAPVHVDRLLDFVSGLQDVSAGRADTATLASLGRALQLQVGLDTVSCVTQGTTLTVPTPRTTPGRLYAVLRPHRSTWMQ
jgi:hypothetical protein